MTEAELIQSAQECWANAISVLAVVISVMSAYLIVAYAVGKDLTRQQVSLINVLYGSFAGFGVYGVYGFSMAAVDMGNVAAEMTTQRTQQPNDAIPLIFLVVLVPMMAGCYKFMWDVRHAKKE